ncbi:MAG: [FeFe] hydrogenase H-cluster radical SAM maturase HydE [Clostridiales bacterium]|nr:[FeFe] hydrogenase H-cluster radical SAM maturase HydE [Clostridiales bacterium]
MNESIIRLTQTRDLPDGELLALISGPEWEAELAQAADAQRRKWYGTDVYVRGLIEFTNYCKNDCYYCGIRKSNGKVDRYRLTEEQILDCCRQGWALGFRTFVLQGGEDPWYTDERICHIVQAIKGAFPACAVTLSIGEKERDSYAAYRAAGADRYLLRHETASDEHYRMLHPASLSLEHRKNCLFTLKELGYQVGSGFMVGSPGQRPEHLLADLRFLQRLQPAMIGIGPYITHPDTPFHDRPSGDLHLTLRMVSILRLMFPYALIPATTALGTIHPRGRELGLQAGANVVMPNLSPVGVREKYSLYENKICTGEEAAECRFCLEGRVRLAGYEIVTARGDVKEDIHD